MTITRRALATFGLVAAMANFASRLDAQWTVSMRTMHPVKPGECTPVEVIAKDANGQVPVRPDGKQVSVWDFDFSVASASPDAWGMQNNDPTRSFLCALAPTAPTALYIAHYPGRQLKPNEIVPGVALQQSIEVTMIGVSPAAASGALPAGVPPDGSLPAPMVTASMQPPPMDPTVSSGPAGIAPPPASGYAVSGAAPVAQVPAPQVAHNGKEFLKKVGGHAWQKAREVAAHTVDYTADAANEAVDTTLEAGSQLVASGIGSAAGGMGQAGRSLFGGAEGVHDSGDLATALANGRVVLKGLRFQEHTATLDPTNNAVLSQLMQAMQARPGQYLIEGHVDQSEGAQAQALSEQRAAAVKAALVSAGISPAQLVAVGYGSTRSLSGSASSARIEIAHTQ
jgi:outer membrane protein OmpA-like peptidoglycan-associated protein